MTKFSVSTIGIGLMFDTVQTMFYLAAKLHSSCLFFRRGPNEYRIESSLSLSVGLMILLMPGVLNYFVAV